MRLHSEWIGEKPEEIHIITLILGIIAIVGAALIIIENQYGSYLLIIIGIVAIVEMLISSISLISSFLYINPLIVALGGLIANKY
ncbi:unnamed protein product [marine sediment metagenome]|uniref:Uncharacterized protein n=1 Tax=marine sediment metagenome TaxID=412755 RepID=X1GD69_9ZZZZ